MSELENTCEIVLRGGPVAPALASRSMRIAMLMLVAGACGGPTPPASAGDPTSTVDDSAHTRPTPAAQACKAGAPTSNSDQWKPGERCFELDQRWRALPASARSCRTDRDCGLVRGPCFDAALRVDVIQRGYSESPCADPLGGVCPPSGFTTAACVDGCCVPR